MVEATIETTNSVDPVERWAFWKDTAMAAVDGMRLDARSPFSARRSVTELTLGTLVDTASGPVSCQRSVRNLRRDGDDGVCLMMLRQGRGVIDQQGAGGRVLPTGDVELFDLARPYTVAVDAPYRETRLYVPRAVFTARVGRIENLVGLRIEATSPLAALFTQYLAGLSDALPSLSRAEADAGVGGALHLLSELVAVQTGAPRSGTDALDDTSLLRLAEQHIAASSSDLRFDATALARTLGVSRATLYRAFADRGGVATAIRHARLDRANREIAKRAGSRPNLKGIAAACGFAAYASFSRAFRERFGRWPLDVHGDLSAAAELRNHGAQMRVGAQSRGGGRAVRRGDRMTA